MLPLTAFFDRVELTASQRGNWVARGLAPDSSVFCAGQLIWLDGAVDPAVFASSVSSAFAEADTLRVRFGDEDGVPFFNTSTRPRHSRQRSLTQVMAMIRSGYWPASRSSALRRRPESR